MRLQRDGLVTGMASRKLTITLGDAQVLQIRNLVSAGRATSGFVEDSGAAKLSIPGVDAEFVLAGADALDERVTFDDHCRGAVGLQSAYGG